MTKRRWAFLAAELALVVLYLGGTIYLQRSQEPASFALRRQLTYAFMGLFAVVAFLDVRGRLKRG